MNAINQSSNRIPCHTDWHRYDSATVFRRHGRDFLERSWKTGWAAKTTATLSKTELHNLVENHVPRRYSFLISVNPSHDP